MGRGWGVPPTGGVAPGKGFFFFFGGQAVVPTPCLRGGESVHWSAHYGSVETVLQGIQSVAAELIMPRSHGAAPGITRQEKGASVAIRKGTAAQISLNQRHLLMLHASLPPPSLLSHCPLHDPPPPLPSTSRPPTCACSLALDAVIIAIASVDFQHELRGLPPNEKPQPGSRGVISLFHYLFNAACIMSII